MSEKYDMGSLKPEERMIIDCSYIRAHLHLYKTFVPPNYVEFGFHFTSQSNW